MAFCGILVGVDVSFTGLGERLSHGTLLIFLGYSASKAQDLGANRRGFFIDTLH